MSDEEPNLAAMLEPVKDAQGDGRCHCVCVCVCVFCMLQVWREFFSPLHALNFGIAGDTTCNVLWRLQNGELQNIRPTVVVVWVGTNNYQHTAEQEVMAIVQVLVNQLPRTKVIVLGLLPHGKRQNPLWEKNADVNRLLRTAISRLSPAQFFDLSSEFVHLNGTVSSRDMSDYLHCVCVQIHFNVKSLYSMHMQ
uniref:Platelet-activating factor acetylhydrolase IB subunit alpha2 n=1 Tax=Electrophorus electricus TaxID=8005 RepID=A0A4W4ESK4_ELEEL